MAISAIAAATADHQTGSDISLAFELLAECGWQNESRHDREDRLVPHLEQREKK